MLFPDITRTGPFGTPPEPVIILPSQTMCSSTAWGGVKSGAWTDTVSDLPSSGEVSETPSVSPFVWAAPSLTAKPPSERTLPDANTDPSDAVTLTRLPGTAPPKIADPLPDISTFLDIPEEKDSIDFILE